MPVLRFSSDSPFGVSRKTLTTLLQITILYSNMITKFFYEKNEILLLLSVNN